MGATMITGRELLSEDGAAALARQIEDYHTERGRAVRCTIEEVVGMKDGAPAFAVRAVLHNWSEAALKALGVRRVPEGGQS